MYIGLYFIQREIWSVFSSEHYKFWKKSTTTRIPGNAVPLGGDEFTSYIQYLPTLFTCAYMVQLIVMIALLPVFVVFALYGKDNDMYDAALSNQKEKTIIRYVSDKGIFEGSETVAPNLEDAFLFVLGGIKR